MDAEVKMKKVDGTQHRIKFISFGKTKVKKSLQKVIMDSNSDKKSTEDVDIIKKQSDMIENQEAWLCWTQWQTHINFQ